jgi:hypothetical protein
MTMNDTAEIHDTPDTPAAGGSLQYRHRGTRVAIRHRPDISTTASFAFAIHRAVLTPWMTGSLVHQG